MFVPKFLKHFLSDIYIAVWFYRKLHEGCLGFSVNFMMKIGDDTKQNKMKPKYIGSGSMFYILQLSCYNKL